MMNTFRMFGKAAFISVFVLTVGLNISSVDAETTSSSADKKSDKIGLPSPTISQSETIFDREKLSIVIERPQDSTKTDLIPGMFEDNGSDFDGFKYDFR